MNITQNFTLEEFIFSDTANRWKIKNEPPGNMVPVITKTCEGLERIRHIIGGSPIIILSGYRCPELNSIVGGAKNSQHLYGEAADIIAPKYGSVDHLARAIAENVILLGVDQVIKESSSQSFWVHVSFSFNPRHEILTYSEGKFHKGIV